MIRLRMKPFGFLTVSIFCWLWAMSPMGFAEITVQSTWISGPTTPPIIDGTITAGEWAGAGSAPIPFSGLPGVDVGYVLVKNDLDNLYLILDIVSDNVNDTVPMQDFFRLTVDVKADRTIEPNVDVQFLMNPSGILGRQYYLGPGSYSALTVDPSSKSKVGVGFGGSPILSSPSHRMWETVINFKDIGLTPDIWSSGIAPVVRIGVRLISANPSFNIAFPASFETNFGELITIILGYPSLPIDPSAPALKGVGNIPRSTIINGYADTWDEPAPILRVKNAPFGGTIDVKGDFELLKGCYYAVKYKIEYIKDGGAPQPLTQAWTNYEWGWDGTKYTYIPYTIKPGADDKYDCLSSPLNDWYWNDLVMRWDTTSFGNGVYQLILTAYDASDAVIGGIPYTTLTLVIDNTPPKLEVKEVYYDDMINPMIILPTCGIVKIHKLATNKDGLRFRVKAWEDEGHLWWYKLTAHYGINSIKAIITKDSANNPMPEYYIADPPYDTVDHFNPASPTPIWYGETDRLYPPLGQDPWKPDLTMVGVCGYQFRLSSYGRTINGYYYLFYTEYNRHSCIEVQ